MIVKFRSVIALVILIALVLGCMFPSSALKRGGLAATKAPSSETVGESVAPSANVSRASASGALDSLDTATEREIEQLFDAVEALTIRVYEKVSPSVVHVTSRVTTMGFFGLYPSEGTGSGFIIHEEGLIVTNYHVIEGAEQIEVTLLDQTVAPAEVVGADPFNDLAVIRVEVDRSKLNPVDMSFEGELKVGQRAIAIGNPFGLDWTLTSGVISSLGRPLQLSADRVIYDVVQMDAAINPGNSGGPLLNSRGQLIGVNSAVRAGAENIGFAIPLSTLRRVLPDLIEAGRYLRPWLGITGYSLSPELSRRLNLSVERGVLIAQMYRGSPASQAGLRGATREVVLGNTRILVGGDIIVEIDGHPIDSYAALREFLETRTRVGDTVQVAFYRGDELQTVGVCWMSKSASLLLLKEEDTTC